MSKWTLIVVLGSLGVGLSVAAAEPLTYAGSETCAGCHAAEYEEWHASRHAGAYSASFTAAMARLGNPHECLLCHTTGYDPERHTFAAKGVSCESCHGPLRPGHPGEATMLLPTDSTVCQSCHQQTYREWQLSGHGRAGLRCFDCHAVHRQGLRQADAEHQCAACHAQRMQDFAHATHHQQGLTCTTCHMPQPRDAGIGGTGAPSHTFFVGSETCAACHEDMVHKSHQLSSLREQVETLHQESTVQHTEALAAELRRQELALDVERSRSIKLGIGALLIGLLLGLIAGLAGRRTNGRRNEPPR